MKLLQSPDIGLAAALVVSGFELHDILHRPERCIFVFERDGPLEKAAQKYWGEDLMVPARQFLEAIRSLKSRIKTYP